MIVSKKHQALVLKLRDPNRVLQIIPNARKLEVDGNTYVAVKHGVEEARVLRNIGINAPSPILYYYDWPGRFQPFHAQREASAFMSMLPRAFNLSGMGTGKTLGTLWPYDYLRSVGRLKRAMVISPLSTLERTWADEVFQHFPHLTTMVLYGDRAKRLKMLDTEADLYLINHDGIKLKGFVEAMAKRSDIDLIIIDEIAQIARNATTDRFKALNQIVNRQSPRDAWGLTGTPTPNEPTDAWAQCRLLVPDRVPPYFKRFRDSVMRQSGPYKWVVRDNATEVVHAAMQPSIRFSLDECVDLPPCVYQTRQVELTTEQARAYKDMAAKLKAEAIAGDILAVNEAVKAQKLVQICCGVAYGLDGSEVIIGAESRLKVVHEIIEEGGSKAIVYVPFISAIGLLKEYLEERRVSTGVIHGGVGKSARDRIFHDFQSAEHPKVLIAQPAAMSHGLTLTAASTIIWYAPIVSNDVFEQANARIVRPGQKLSQLIVTIEGSAIERKRYEQLRNKQKAQGLLLDLVQDQREPLAA